MQNKSLKKIAILGCGWLGFPLAKSLINAGYLVNGSTTTEDKLAVLKANKINPYLIKLGDDVCAIQLQEFLEVDLLIVNVPPGRTTNTADLYVAKMDSLKKAVLNSKVTKVIFISSTSVYAENDGIHTDDSLTFSIEGNAERLLLAEDAFLALPNTETTIIRMAGLIGPDRHPGRFFAGKADIPNGLVPVNLIHLDDCIGIITKVLEDSLWNNVFNGVAKTHPTKQTFYNLASIKLSGKTAEFIAEKGAYKIIEGNKIIKHGYQFKHPDLLDWLEKNPQN